MTRLPPGKIFQKNKPKDEPASQNEKTARKAAEKLLFESRPPSRTHAGGPRARGKEAGGSYYNDCRNANSIGIEMCSVIRNGVYVIPDETVRNAAELVRYLMARHHVPVSRICRHYDVTRKDCPEPWVRNPKQWEKFLEMLEVEDMTEAQTRKIAQEEIKKANAKIYDRVQDCPKWAQDTVQRLVNKGFLQGDENGKLGLTEDLMRVLVINDRAHLYG